MRESAYLAGLAKIDTGQEPFRPFRVLYYQSRYEFTPSFIVDISDYRDRKMMRGASPIDPSSSSPRRGRIAVGRAPDPAPETAEAETMLSRPEFLDAIEIRDRRWGARIGVKYGEPFVVREPLAVDDPAAFFGPGRLGMNP